MYICVWWYKKSSCEDIHTRKATCPPANLFHWYVLTDRIKGAAFAVQYTSTSLRFLLYFPSPQSSPRHAWAMVDPAIMADPLGKSNASVESRVMPDSEYCNTRPSEERRESCNNVLAKYLFDAPCLGCNGVRFNAFNAKAVWSPPISSFPSIRTSYRLSFFIYRRTEQRFPFSSFPVSLWSPCTLQMHPGSISLDAGISPKKWLELSDKL